MKLVIVESPAKAKTIGAFLGDDYDVEASVGHIRDLPQPSELPEKLKKGPYGKFSVDVDNGFDPYYVVDSDKKKKVTELKKALADADELFLATDEDREGEAIAWHLLETLKPKIPVKRMVFNEITREAIDRALANPRDIDLQLVDAQETRRILDRLYGYEVSPLLWRKIGPKLSAGRVQSVATRLVVERERERRAFVPANYWSVEATLEGGDGDGAETFTAKLATLDGRPQATGSDFADDGKLKPAAIRKDAVVLTEETANAVAASLGGATVAVTDVESKPSKRSPYAPFTTSTLQQEASSKLGLNSRQTMSQAQQLYENGYITYMRTDSLELSKEAISAARFQIKERYGDTYVPDKPRYYTRKSKGAQEAHEAIRPAGDHFRTPEQVRSALTPIQYKLYDLIWRRTIASQMVDAQLLTVSAKFSAGIDAAGFSEATLSASGRAVTFPGFLAVYDEVRKKDKSETRLPNLERGDVLDVVDPGAVASGHSTNPPARYTDASLVKKLEELGIGRPSTYASTISVITDRGYVERVGQALVPTWVAFSVVRLLEETLPSYVDYDFTAQLEESLDEIARGSRERVSYLESFYHGDDAHEGLAHLVEHMADVDARAINTIDLGGGFELRVGKYGPYIENTNEQVSGDQKPVRANVPRDLAPDELTLEKAKELYEVAKAGDRVIGIHPETGLKILAKDGRYGPYVTEELPEDAPKGAKSRTGSLFKSMDLATISLDEAVSLLSLPRELVSEGEEPIMVANGRYGPYIKQGKETRSLESEEQLLTLTLDEAKALLAQPKQRGRRTAAAPLKEFGEDPISGKNVVLKDGRFGMYVTDGEVNASLRKDDDPETIRPERAFELLQMRRDKLAANPPKKRTTRRSTAKGATPRKSTKKKS